RYRAAHRPCSGPRPGHRSGAGAALTTAQRCAILTGRAGLAAPRPLALLLQALPVRRDVENAPQLSVGPQLYRPVAMPVLAHGLVEPERVLHHYAGLVHCSGPGFGLGEVLDLGDRTPQRHVALVRVIAGERRCADETQGDEAPHRPT